MLVEMDNSVGILKTIEFPKLKFEELNLLVKIADEIRIRDKETYVEVDVVFVEETEYKPADIELFEQVKKEVISEEESEEQQTEEEPTEPEQADEQVIGDAGDAYSESVQREFEQDKEVSIEYGKIAVNDDVEWKELTDKVSYRIINDEFILGHKNSNGKYTILTCRPVSKLNEIHRLLEDKNSSKDVKFFCDSIGLKVNDCHITYLMRLIADLFDDCELKEGHPLTLIRR
jgi:hypothetical protein